MPLNMCKLPQFVAVETMMKEQILVCNMLINPPTNEMTESSFREYSLGDSLHSRSDIYNKTNQHKQS